MSKELIEKLRKEPFPDENLLIAAADTIERLERELADIDAHYQAALEAEQVRFHQYATSQKQIVMLREALRFCKSALTADDVAGRALSATADIGRYVICEGEPVAFMAADQGGVHLSLDADKYHEWIPLYAHPMPPPDVIRDAERYRWLRDKTTTRWLRDVLPRSYNFDADIDFAMKESK